MSSTALEYLMGTYFHQDWAEDRKTLHGVIVAFVEQDPADAPALPDEIEQVLAAFPEESDLQRFLTDDLGTDHYARPEEGGYRGWLLQLKDLVEAELTRPTAGRARQG